ncbi:MAG TPA: hypothetical protein VHB47_12105, partial [Thermoanaerobaculia bacterium]|nr:hypothetical protein [Thermoanaerobaculia bacterium]
TALCGSWQKPDVDRPFAGALEGIPRENDPDPLRETGRQRFDASERPPQGPPPGRPGRAASRRPSRPGRNHHPREKGTTMGDRTSCSLEALVAARPSVEDAFRQEADEEEEGEHSWTVLLTFHEVDGGGLELLSRLAQSMVAFRGSCGDGLEYYGMTFAAIDGDFAATPSPQGELMVGIDSESGEVSAPDLGAFQRWRDIDRRVLAFFARAGL